MCSLFALYQGDGDTDLGEHIQYVRHADLGINSSRNGFPVISWKIRLLQFDWQKEYNMCQEIVDAMDGVSIRGVILMDTYVS